MLMTENQIATIEKPEVVEGEVMEERQLPTRTIAGELMEGAQTTHRSTSAEVAIAEAKAKAVASRFTAREYKRDTKEALALILDECKDPVFAFKALSRREDAHALDASIRLLEVCAGQYGNVDYGIRMFSRDNGMTELEIYVRDTERGTEFSDSFMVPHIRYTKNDGLKPVTIPASVSDLVAAETSKRLRKGLKKIILPSIIRKAVDQCHATQEKALEDKANTMKMLLDRYEQIGVDKMALQNYLKKTQDKWEKSDLKKLYGLFTAIREGEQDLAKAFPNAKPKVDPSSVPAIAQEEEEKPSKPEKQAKQPAKPSPTKKDSVDSNAAPNAEASSSPAPNVPEPSPPSTAMSSESSSEPESTPSPAPEEPAPTPEPTADTKAPKKRIIF
jgi:hypothetical protein